MEVWQSQLLDVASEAKSCTLLGDRKNGLLFAQIGSSTSPFLTVVQRKLDASPNVSKHSQLYFVKPELIYIHFCPKIFRGADECNSLMFD